MPGWGGGGALGAASRWSSSTFGSTRMMKATLGVQRATTVFLPSFGALDAAAGAVLPPSATFTAAAVASRATIATRATAVAAATPAAAFAAATADTSTPRMSAEFVHALIGATLATVASQYLHACHGARRAVE